MTSPDGLHPNAQRVQAALRANAAQATVVTLTDSARTAVDAAATLGCPVGAIVKSLVFLADRRPVLILASGANTVDESQVAAVLGVSQVVRADADTVRKVTGFPIGGVAPIGHPAPLGTLVDITLQQFDRVWAAAGTPHTVFPTSYGELLRMTAGDPVEVT